MKTFFIFLLATVFSISSLFSQCLCNPRHPFDDCINDGFTEATAYQLWSKEHLIELGDSIDAGHEWGKTPWTENKHFRLMQDINDTLKQSIGWTVFRGGHFHGNGKKITVAITATSFPPDPFHPGTVFGGLTGGGVIDGLTVEGYITTYTGGAGIVGSIGGAAWDNSHPASTVMNCTSNVTITNIQGNLTGGVTRTNNGIISNSVFNGSIVGLDRIGGIAGDNSGQIINCINNGKIVATGSGDNSTFSGVGGIVGTIANVGAGIVVSHNINNGIVEGQGFVGGIIGLAVSHPLVPTVATNNINYGFIKGTNAVGGILGNAFFGPTNIFNNFNSGVVIGVSETGCIVGRNTGGTVSNNHYDKQMCGE